MYVVCIGIIFGGDDEIYTREENKYYPSINKSSGGEFRYFQIR
jgi:hypothetical protein